MVEHAMNLAGIILCGGESKRMGQPKAWLPFGDEFMLPRVARLLSEVARPIVVVAAPGQELPPLPEGISLVRDEERGRGPLQGLAAGLQALASSADAAYVSSCDVPFLRPAFVRRMGDLLGDASICVPRVGEHHHTLAAVYKVSVLPTVRRLLAADRLRPFFLFETVPTRIVAAEELIEVDPQFHSLRNLNSPDEYEAALRELRSAE
jgi:molybdopterin-guanine dinucleotide biosynthesis protein A